MKSWPCPCRCSKIDCRYATSLYASFLQIIWTLLLALKKCNYESRLRSTRSVVQERCITEEVAALTEEVLYAAALLEPLVERLFSVLIAVRVQVGAC